MPVASIAQQIQSARKRRASRDVEGPVHRDVLRYLRLSLPHGFVIQHTPNKPRSAIQGSREKGLGAIKGWPDLAVYGPGPDGPGVWFAEVKAPGGQVSPEQREVHERLMDCGFAVRVVRSVDDMRKAVRDWRLPSNDMLIRDTSGRAA